MNPNVCRFCGASIRWALTDRSTRMPIDPHPHQDGNVLLGHDDNGIQTAHVMLKDETTTEPRYKSHFATCSARPQRTKTGRLKKGSA